MILCVKIGENEPETYSKFNRLSKHFDIVDALPRNKTSAGIDGNKEYFIINIDTDKWTDEEYNRIRQMLREIWVDKTVVPDKNGEYPFVAKRLRKMTFDSTKFKGIGITAGKLNQINANANKRRNKQIYDMTSLNIMVKVPFSAVAKLIENKDTGQTLEEELA